MAYKLKITYDNNKAKLECHEDLDKVIFSYLSFLDPKRFYSPAYKEKLWNGYHYFYDIHRKEIPTGLVVYLCSLLELRGWDVEYELIDVREKTFTQIYSSVDDLSLDGIKLRESQKKALRKILNAKIEGRGVLQAFTGCGKTEILCCLVKMFKGKMLLVAPDTYLAKQLFDRLKLRGIENVVLFTDSDNEEEIDKNDVVVSNIQLLASRIKKYRKGKYFSHKKVLYGSSKFINFLDNVELVFLDEVHTSSSSSYEELLSLCKNSYYRLGVSATPFKDSQMDDLKILASIGVVIGKITCDELVSEGSIANPTHIFLEGCEYKKSPEILRLVNDDIKEKNKVLKQSNKKILKLKTKPAYSDVYDYNIVNNSSRNAEIIKVCELADRANIRALLFVTKINHGKKLKKILDEKNICCQFVSGCVSIEEREKCINRFEEYKCNILIATTVFDAGVDIDGGTELIILGGGGKARTSIIQRTGRGVRLQKDGINEVFVIDFLDKGLFLGDHSNKRFEHLQYFGFSPKIQNNYKEIEEYVNKRRK